jgi:ABC-type antimicrobial peptide transport system permease subunit
MKAIGFPPGRILGSILAESILIALAGWGLSCALGLLLFNLLGLKPPMLWTPLALTPWSASLSASIALLIGLVSGFIPGVIAARLRVVDGLRKVA